MSETFSQPSSRLRTEENIKPAQQNETVNTKTKRSKLTQNTHQKTKV